MTFRDQLQRNLVAVISVLIAVGSLSYNTWRNVKNEYNRNQRQGSVQVLAGLSELREITFHLRGDTKTVEEGALRSGWVKVLTVKDLSQVVITSYSIHYTKLYESISRCVTATTSATWTSD